MMVVPWDALSTWYLSPNGEIDSISISGTPIDRFVDKTSNPRCASFVDPREEVIQSLNKLSLRFGALAAEEDESYLQSSMDPGLSIKQTVDGYLKGHQSVFHTDYWFFLAAAIVEVVCILFVAPT